ncbi:DNA-directed RNA polymerase I subunit RPA34 [Catharus ustulatus]|uniref:DNA-directed RNA polymerase I subunit RPA34 n=1 Tax=Catharus ustulatus TaxID=91951 RepID=UPI00140A2BFB|nr:DNA-directed RNA polymerase I subunit RPA34 [Catharus ustulatus]
MDAAPPRFQRFRCPPEFEAVAPGVALAREGPRTELWLIRAPADFCPQSLEGCPVPLNGLERLRTGDNNGDNDTKDTKDTKLYVLRAGPGGGDCPLLLSPVSPEGSLGCAPPLRGSLTITQSFGDPPAPPPRRQEEEEGEGDTGAGGTWGHGDIAGDGATRRDRARGGARTPPGRSGGPRGGQEEEEEEECHLCHLCHLCHH